jgi:ABC-2 type transport system permease protein
MLKHTIKYEWLNLLRDKWVIILLVLFLGVTLFSVRNGKEKVADRTTSIRLEKEKMVKLDKKFAADIDSLNRNLKPAPEPWRDPRSLSTIAWNASRVASMEPRPLALIATGQSDLFSHSVKPKISNESYTLGFSELSNPVQLLFGSFDLAFVCIYLLPLLVLAFSYNILSSEKESGVLRLTMAQPVSLYSWLFGKLLLRFLILTSIITVSILFSLSVFGIDVIEETSTIAQLMAIVIVYIFFWFLVSFFVNLLGNSSGSNAVVLVAIWMVLVLLVPSIISQTANSFYPVPSRTIMIHEFREEKALASKRADEILKSFYREHPELAPRDSTEKNPYGWWLNNFAANEVIDKSVQPILQSYSQALSKQQSWVDQWAFLSPAILLQDGLNDLAGTSPAHYADFRSQVIAFSDTWHAYFRTRMFKNEKMNPKDFETLPHYTYSSTAVPSKYVADMMGIFLFAVCAVAASMWAYRTYRVEKILQSA